MYDFAQRLVKSRVETINNNYGLIGSLEKLKIQSELAKMFTYSELQNLIHQDGVCLKYSEKAMIALNISDSLGLFQPKGHKGPF